ncbi:hypothetical protein LK494_03080 [Anaerovorax odorimutans]|nr:hypothetical protein [Anaerovorax odorimutans]
MKKKIIKRALEEMRAAKMQVDSIEKSIETLNQGFAKDTVRGSSPNFPYTEHPITIEGYNNVEREKLIRALDCKRTVWYKKIRLAERVLREVEPEMQDILRRHYELGQTMEQIGKATGYTRARVSQKIKGYFEKD